MSAAHMKHPTAATEYTRLHHQNVADPVRLDPSPRTQLHTVPGAGRPDPTGEDVVAAIQRAATVPRGNDDDHGAQAHRGDDLLRHQLVDPTVPLGRSGTRTLVDDASRREPDASTNVAMSPSTPIPASVMSAIAYDRFP